MTIRGSQQVRRNGRDFIFPFFTAVQNSPCKLDACVRAFAGVRGEKGKMVDSLSSQSAPLKPSGHRQM